MSKRTRLLSKLKQKNKEGYSYLLEKEECDMCIEAIEKQIPIKVKYRQGVTYEYCPACDFAHLYSGDEYCSECGQKVEIEME